MVLRHIVQPRAVPDAFWLLGILGLFCLRIPLATFAHVPPLLVSLLVLALIPLACRKRGGALACMALVAGVVGFEELRSLVARDGLPVHAGDLLHLEEAISFGVLPTATLQHLLYSSTGPGAIDYATVVIHGSYFIAPYAALVAVWAWRPSETWRLALPLLITLGVGLLINAAAPSMPPWLAASYLGLSDIHRVLYVVLQSAVGSSLSLGESLGDPNPTASLPSIHFAVTVVLFLYARERSRLLGFAGAGYCLAMAFSLVYLGEHYLVDCILASLVAIAAWQVSQKLPRSLSELAYLPSASRG